MGYICYLLSWDQKNPQFIIVNGEMVALAKKNGIAVGFLLGGHREKGDHFISFFGPY
jgi:hypothetical protein